MNVNNAAEVNGNIVGVEVKSIQDLVKAQDAGLIVTDENGCRYNYNVEDEETGEERANRAGNLRANHHGTF